MAQSTEAGEDAPVYTFRPRMVGSEIVFRLGPDALEWFAGTRSGRLGYATMRRVRLGFRLTNFMNRRYTAELFPQGGGRLEISSLSARSLGGSDNRGPEYRAFVTELHRRIARTGAECRFEGGMAAWRWWPSATISGVLAVAIVVISGRALLAGQFTTGALMLVVGGLFAWQMVPMLIRNRPSRYRPDAIPGDLLP